MTDPAATETLLQIRDLHVGFSSRSSHVAAVAGLDLDVAAGEIVGLVGESGCGKTVTALTVLGLLPPSARVNAGRILYKGRDLLQLDRRALRRIRGAEIAMVFQDPLSSLHPSLTIGSQLVEALLVHDGSLTGRAAWGRAVDLLALVGIPEPAHRMRDYPHQWSGGMRQRAMIAMAIANRPSLIIADEPTTALDVTVQAQIIELLRAVRNETDAALLLITHDLGVVAELCDRVVVIYAGRTVEVGSVSEIFHRPAHPYSEGLLASLLRLDGPIEASVAMLGQAAQISTGTLGCPFQPRCPVGMSEDRCRCDLPNLEQVTPDHWAACHHPNPIRSPH